MLQTSAVGLVTQNDDGLIAHHRVKPLPGRPVLTLPFDFWLQTGVGLFGILIGCWIWAAQQAIRLGLIR